MRDNSCVCDDCRSTNATARCKVKKNGVYMKFSLDKRDRNRQTGGDGHVEQDAEGEDVEDDEFEYHSECDDSSDG